MHCETIVKYSFNIRLSLSFKPSPLFLTIITIAIIIFAIVITAAVQPQPEKPFSQIITVGPVWTTNSWSCTSDKDFIVHGTLRGLEGAQLVIGITDLGTQSLYSLDAGKMQTFSLGSPGGHTMTITSSISTVTGFITLQTTSDANANCTQ